MLSRRPDRYFFYSRILDSSVTRPCWAGRLKSNSFLATPIAACTLCIALYYFLTTHCKKEVFKNLSLFCADLLPNWSSTFSAWRFPGNRSFDG